MDFYTFTVSEFEIFHTRALITDTLSFGWAAYVDGQLAAPVRVITPHIDFNNGQYSMSDYVPSDTRPGLARVVINNPNAQVVFSFQLLNAGNVPDGALTGRIVATADQLAGMAGGVGGVLLEAFANIYAWLSVDCDGPVAVDQISHPRYVLDALTDNPQQSISFDRRYEGSESPDGCNGNSDYEVWWSLSHQRDWVQVEAFPTGLDPAFFASETGVSAASHYGAVHAFGVVDGFNLGLSAGPAVTQARTFKGDSWTVDTVGSFDLASRPGGAAGESLPVSAASFNDRLYVFGVHKDGSVSSLAYTVDGSSWVTQEAGPTGVRTTEAVTTVVFRYRLYLFSRDTMTNHLILYWTSDLDTWQAGGTVLEPAGPPPSSVAAVELRGTLHLFGVYRNPRDEAHVAILHKSTPDGITWTGWDIVEGGAHPVDPATFEVPEPLDVAAGVFRDRIYVAARWRPTNHIAVNFSGNGADWSGWRFPERDPDPDHLGAGPLPPDLAFLATAALAPVDHHLYIFSPRDGKNADGLNVVYAY